MAEDVKLDPLDGKRIELRPNTIEEALVACQRAIVDPNVCVVPTSRLFIDMLQILIKIKRS